MTVDASFGKWGASGRTRHNVVSMTSQPPLRLLILCREASRALQDAVVDTEELPTSYQVVAVPEDLKVYVRIPGVQDWIEVDLNLFFQEEGGAGLSGHQL